MDYSSTGYDAATAGAAGAIFGALMIYYVIILIIAVLQIIGMWKVFTKAGQPGWAAIIPIYNYYIMTQIAGQPAWYIILYMIPLVNIFAFMDFVKAYGKGTGFAVGLGLLGPIFMIMLGFGSAKYEGAAAA